MNESIFTAASKWLWNHKPDVTILVVAVTGSIWLANNVDDATDRLDRVEETCTEIRSADIPALRKDMDVKFEEVNKRFKQVDKQFEQVDKRFEKMEMELFEIKIFMKKLDTYFATKDKNYPKE